MLGKRIAHFEIIDELGSGGMGVVYRARDTRLERQVAIKALPETLSEEPGRLARLKKEARALASLNHSHIGAIYGLEEIDNQHYLILELIEGETLAEMIQKGPIPLGKSIELGCQIAAALETAHDSGIIHRDLKPANVKVTPQGEAKVLDFGLAKRTEDLAGGKSKADSVLPTATWQKTQPGVVLGTAPYMSPEQGRGETVDRQTDVWAFGCLMYELLTGRRAFDAPTLGDTLVAILSREPDWSALPPQTPPRLRTTLHRCLEKDPLRRAHHLGDVRLDLEEAATPGEMATPPSSLRKRLSTIVPWVAAVLLAGFSLWTLLQSGKTSRPVGATRFSVKTAPLAIGIHPPSPIVALSPDGSLLAYVVGSGDAGQIYLRSMDSPEASPVAGTEGAQAPFFSPDGDWIAFATDGHLKKVKTSGGRIWTICEVRELHGASWGSDDHIVFSDLTGGLRRVDANGGESIEITRVDRDARQSWHAFPQILPGDKQVLFSALGYDGIANGTHIVSLETSQVTQLSGRVGNARYLSPGYLSYPDDGSILVVPFDERRLEITGSPFAALEGLMMGFPREPAMAHFAVADNGTVAYIAGDLAYQTTRLARVDREGRVESLGALAKNMLGPRFSPDGTRIAVAAATDASVMQVHVLDIARGAFSGLTPGRTSWWPLWTLDGRDITFTSILAGDTWDIFRRPADRSQPSKRLTQSSTAYQSNSWSSDGRTLVLQGADLQGLHFDLFSLDVESSTKPELLIAGTYNARSGALSADNRWLAYVSDESGQDEVYVQSFPDLEGKWQISMDGGTGPVWAPDGGELFYLQGSRMTAVSIASNADMHSDPNSRAEIELTPGKPEVLFSGSFAENIEFGRNFDIAPDGKSFVMIEYVPPEPVTEVQVILNWVQSVESELAPGS
jgi:serine/threonine-protein kinase